VEGNCYAGNRQFDDGNSWAENYGKICVKQLRPAAMRRIAAPETKDFFRARKLVFHDKRNNIAYQQSRVLLRKTSHPY